MRVLRVLGWILGVLVALGVVVFFAPRFVSDGPIGPLLGGPLRSGELYELPVSDWSFATDVKEIALQLDSQSSSRTTWILVRDGAAYIPCSLGFPPGKSWFDDAQRDGRAVLRVEGKRYPVTLARDDDPTLAEFARAEVTRKYGNLPPSEAGVMFFKVASRPTTGG